MKLNKENLNTMINTFCKITTIILIVCCLDCVFISKIQRLYSVTDILSIMLIALISVLLTIPFYSQKQLSKKVQFIMQILYFIEVNISCILIGFWQKWFSFDKITTLAPYEAVIVITYALVMIINYKIASTQAKEMNKKLQERKSE